MIEICTSTCHGKACSFRMRFTFDQSYKTILHISKHCFVKLLSVFSSNGFYDLVHSSEGGGIFPCNLVGAVKPV